MPIYPAVQTTSVSRHGAECCESGVGVWKSERFELFGQPTGSRESDAMVQQACSKKLDSMMPLAAGGVDIKVLLLTPASARSIL